MLQSAKKLKNLKIKEFFLIILCLNLFAKFYNNFLYKDSSIEIPFNRYLKSIKIDILWAGSIVEMKAGRKWYCKYLFMRIFFNYYLLRFIDFLSFSLFLDYFIEKIFCIYIFSYFQYKNNKKCGDGGVILCAGKNTRKFKSHLW